MKKDARKGKIARLPERIRDEVCRRLLDGQTGPEICTWVNRVPEVKAILKAHFGGKPIRDNNLSEWRKGGFIEWRDRREMVAETKDLARFSIEMARADGQNLTEGAAVIVAGKFVKLLRDLVKAKKLNVEEFTLLTNSLAKLRAGDQNAQKLEQTREQLDQNAEALELDKQKFRRETCGLFLEWREDERARSIADGPGSNAEKIEALGRAMFGPLWEAEGEKLTLLRPRASEGRNAES